MFGMEKKTVNNEEKYPELLARFSSANLNAFEIFKRSFQNL
jgi:hypothetical protein